MTDINSELEVKRLVELSEKLIEHCRLLHAKNNAMAKEKKELLNETNNLKEKMMEARSKVLELKQEIMNEFD